MKTVFGKDCAISKNYAVWLDTKILSNPVYKVVKPHGENYFIDYSSPHSHKEKKWRIHIPMDSENPFKEFYPDEELKEILEHFQFLYETK